MSAVLISSAVVPTAAMIALWAASLRLRDVSIVDVFYDQRVRLVMSAEAVPEELVAPAAEPAGPGAAVRSEFARTASRLREMQSRDYFARKHASADNPHVLRARQPGPAM